MEAELREKARRSVEEWIEFHRKCGNDGDIETYIRYRTYIFGALALARKLELLTEEEYLDLFTQVG